MTAFSKRICRWARRAALLSCASACAWIGAYAGGWVQLATPVDILLNLKPIDAEWATEEPRPPSRDIVVLIHGLARGTWCLWRLERALEAQGYEVWSEGYDSRTVTAAEAARAILARLEAPCQSAHAAGRKIHAVAHSLGGLVLRRIDADAVGWKLDRALCLGTPQRGALVAEALHTGWFFRSFLGSAASQDLLPHSDFVAALPVRAKCAMASIVGAQGNDWGATRVAPGDDDGRVALRETELEGEAARLVLKIGHTALTTDDRVIAAVLRYLGSGSF